MACLDLIVFSHLRWSFVYQRPQQLLSRLAENRRVVFIEEPLHTQGIPTWQRARPEPNVLVCQPHTNIQEIGFHETQLAGLKMLIEQLVAEECLERYAAWLYTPMALPLVDALEPELVVYDCMDELSTFLHAPPELAAREAELLQRAALMFTGGPSLYRAKKHLHGNIHCFPSSVDNQHFARARADAGDARATEAQDQQSIPGPRLGYFGVIDERLDLALIDHLAAHRDWHIVMVGPTVKIDPATLPRRPNIHYLGMRPYEELPSYLVGWDICLMPFARNEATRFISPTKLLEYMAAERPVVATPITDVIEPYGDIVYHGATPEEFTRACEQALAAPPAEAARRTAGMRKALGRTSWTATAQAMAALIDSAAARPARSVPALTSVPSSHAHADTRDAAQTAQARSPRSPGIKPASTPPVVVVGAGPTGLSAAYHLGKDALLLEANDTVGGLCRSIEVNGFTFDYAGHIMFSQDPYVHELYEMLLGNNVHWQDREAWIYSNDVFTRYPFQGALYGLPVNVITDCLVGAIEARFGRLDSPGPTSGDGRPPARARASTATTSRSDAPRDIGDCCAHGVLESTVPLGSPTEPRCDSSKPKNFEEFIYSAWGAGIAEHFAIPYNKKLWAVDLKEMEISWLGGRVPLPDLREMIEGALQPVSKPMGPNARFGYPLHGGFQALMNGFLPHLEGPLWLGAKVIAVSPRHHRVHLEDGRVVPYAQLISTMPLPVLTRLMGDEAPEAVQQAADELRYISVRCVHLGIGREQLTDKHWIYYPGDTVFHRIFVQGNASPHCNPPGGFGLTCEITYSASKPLPCDGDALIERCLDDCKRVGLVSLQDPVWAATQVDLPYAYVVYDHARSRNVGLIREWLAKQDIILAGRYSEWEYYNSDHAFLAGKRAAEQYLSGARQRRTASH